MVSWFSSFNFVTNFYFKLFKLFFILLKYTMHNIYMLFLLLKKQFLYIYTNNTTLKKTINILFNVLCKFFLYFFKILPWYIHNIVFKVHFCGLVKIIFFKIKTLLYNYSFFKNMCVTFSFFFQKNFKKISKKFRHTHSYIWVYVLNFIKFFIVQENVDFFKKLMLFLINIILIFLTTYFFLKTNIIVVLHNFLLNNSIDVFTVWDFTLTKYNYLYLFILLLNLDNLILLLYIIFIKIGFINVFFFQEEEALGWLFWVFYYWNYYFFEYKLNNQNFSFTNLLIDNFIKNSTPSTLISFIFFDSFSQEIPSFFFFGILFFLSVVFSWNFFSYLGLNGIFKLNLLTLFSFWVSLLFYIKVIFVNQKVFILGVGNWFFLNLNIRVDHYFLIDTISFSFILLTTSIALFVYIYAFSYFRYEPLVDRFLLFILSFVISMIFLVSSGNTVMLFLGWELIGFTSFCLINFWTTKTATLKSAFKAFTFNKISDFFLFLFLVLSFSVYYTFDIVQINKITPHYTQYNIYMSNNQISILELLSVLLLGAAFIKSAQIGGHAWLPDSMEAPVPASALIHSATLVSAGIYLVLRFNPIFDSTEFVKFLIPIVGSVTAAYGGLCAIAQSDIKKTLAYSTISHCGFLMVLCSTEMNEFTILYLYVHGFFKAGVFMCVGNVLRISRGYQDTRRMGALLKYMLFDYFCLTIGLLNLAGIPFTFGFLIKHLLLVSLNNNICLYYFVLFNSFVGAFAGLFYSYKIVTYTFCDFKKGDVILYNSLNKVNHNSSIYTNSSLAGTASVFFLFSFSSALIFYLFNCFLSGSYLFSDYINTTLLLNYLTINYTFVGFLLNFSYVNIVAVLIINYLFWSKFKKVLRYYNFINFFFITIVLFCFIYVFYSIL